MTTPILIADLQRDEGLRLTAYRDSVGVLTNGYGHTGADVFPGQRWTQAQAEHALAADIATAVAELDERLPWWRDMDDVRQDAIANMCFNLGIGSLEGFHHTLAAMKAGDWQKASAGMLASRWASQVGDRAQRLAFMVRTGSRPSHSPQTKGAA